MHKQQPSARYMRIVITAGACACAVSALTLDPSVVDMRLFLLAAFTVLVGSRIGVSIPVCNSEITVSDTFIFLIILFYGGEAAVLTAAAEAFCSSFRFNRLWVSRLFNAAMLACSTFVTASLMRAFFGDPRLLVGGASQGVFIASIFFMASVQYAANSGMAALRDSLKHDSTFGLTWHTRYLWTSITYFAGASAAGAIAKLTGVWGVYAFAISIPIVFIIYLTYRTYRRTLEEAERYGRELRDREEYFRSAFDHAAGMAVISPPGAWLKVNRSLCRILGRGEEELLVGTLDQVLHQADLAGALDLIGRLLGGEADNLQSEVRCLHSGGQVVWVLLSVSLVSPEAGGESRLILQMQDVTDRKRAEERLLHEAFHDPLTGLPNRALFMDHLRRAVARARRPGYAFAVLYLDLDRFKVINDSLGHGAGDQLLVQLAHRLRTCLRPSDTVARLGGDEFTILLEETSAKAAAAVAVRVQSELSLPLHIEGGEVFTTASIGVAPSSTGYERAEDILRDADTAMYRAKSMGKARHVIFDRQMHEQAMNALQLETDLRRAVVRGELFVHYQPIVSLDGGSAAGFEALVRWRHPTRGMVAPADFIPVAEETGMIVELGRWVLGEACRQMRQWGEQHAWARGLSISVNLSGRQFTQGDLVERTVETLRETGLDPRLLKLEITESVVMDHIEASADKLARLRQLGVRVAVDDFGTGYSSLSYLHRLPIDTLKIDRSFVTRMSGDDENSEIVRTIITLAKSLGLSVTAEGVETTAQRDLLHALGCDCAQGYLFARPAEAGLIPALMEERVKTLAAPPPMPAGEEVAAPALA